MTTAMPRCPRSSRGRTGYARAWSSPSPAAAWRPASAAFSCTATWPTTTRSPPSSPRSEEHTSELQSPCNLVCRLLLEKKKTTPHQRLIKLKLFWHVCSSGNSFSRQNLFSEINVINHPEPSQINQLSCILLL